MVILSSRSARKLKMSSAWSWSFLLARGGSGPCRTHWPLGSGTCRVITHHRGVSVQSEWYQGVVPTVATLCVWWHTPPLTAISQTGDVHYKTEGSQMLDGTDRGRNAANETCPLFVLLTGSQDGCISAKWEAFRLVFRHWEERAIFCQEAIDLGRQGDTKTWLTRSESVAGPCAMESSPFT